MTGPVVDALLPPAILAILAFALLIAGRYRAAFLALTALVLFAVEGVSFLLISPLLLPPAAPPNPAPAAVVVLASGMPGLLDTSRTAPGIETLKRLRTAAALSRTTGTPILVSGAGETEDAVAVATRMAASLDIDFHVPATWVETNSSNLWQSAIAVAAILRPVGITNIYLVAQASELRLPSAVFRAAGLVVTPTPVPHAQASKLDFTLFAIDTSAWLGSAMALREWAGLACQALPSCAAWMRTQAAP